MTRTDADRRRWVAARSGPKSSRSSSSSAWPTRITHERLDELAAGAGITFPEGASKLTKVSTLEAAGVRP